MLDVEMTQGLRKIEVLLKSYNVIIEESDLPLIMMLVEDVELEIKNFCNISEIPIELENVIVKRVCGHFLDTLSNNTIVSAPATVKAKTLGDTRIEMAINGVDQKKEIEKLKQYGNDILLRYRRIVWR